MQHLKIYILSLFCLCGALGLTTAQAQGPVLQVKNTTLGKAKQVKMGHRVHYALISDTNGVKKRYRGTVDGMYDSVLVISGNIISLNDLQMIGRRYRGLAILKTGGKVLSVPLYIFGTGQIFLGATIFTIGAIGHDHFMWIGGALDLIFGNFNRTAALVPWMAGYPKWDISHGWQFQIIK